MGFFTGRVTFLRFRVDGPAPKLFGTEHLGKLSDHAIGKQHTASKDGTKVGWIAGEDILDTGFDLAKNIVDDTLHFALRVDSQKLPADLLRAYSREELQTLAAENPSGRPSVKQKKQARETARERLEMEAQDGRFLRRKAFPLFWDGQANQVLIGTTSAAASGAKLPAGEESDERARVEERVSRLRHLLDTLDLLYAAFLARRLGAAWPEEQVHMQRWLQREEKGRMAAAG